MSFDEHMQGFEKEQHLHELFGEVGERFPSLYKWKDFEWIVNLLHPELLDGAFERRECKRRLRYIGHVNFDLTEQEKAELNAKARFKVGEIYTSVTFNGATYTIEGFEERCSGCVYFEVVSDDQL